MEEEKKHSTYVFDRDQHKPDLLSSWCKHPSLPHPLPVNITKAWRNCIAANRLSNICRPAAAIGGSGADVAQPEMCQHWSLVSPKHGRVNLGFSLRIAQQCSPAKYSTVDLISSVIRQRIPLLFSERNK